MEVRPAEVRLGENRLTEVGPLEVCPVEVCPRKCSPGEIKILVGPFVRAITSGKNGEDRLDVGRRVLPLRGRRLLRGFLPCNRCGIRSGFFLYRQGIFADIRA